MTAENELFKHQFSELHSMHSNTGDIIVTENELVKSSDETCNIGLVVNSELLQEEILALSEK